MKRYARVTCEGIAPLFLNFPNGHAAELKSVARVSATQEAKLRFSTDADNRPLLPSEAIAAALQWAVTPDGKKQKPLERLGIRVVEEAVPIFAPGSTQAPTWKPVVLPIRSPAAGESMAGAFPQMDRWQVQLTLEYPPEEKMPLADLIEAFERAGNHGVGFHSPFNGQGRGGRFKVTRWEESAAPVTDESSACAEETK